MLAVNFSIAVPDMSYWPSQIVQSWLRHEKSAVNVESVCSLSGALALFSALSLFYCVFFHSAKMLRMLFQNILKILYWDIIVAALTFTSKPAFSETYVFF